MRPIRQFIEKPDAAAALGLFRTGSVWNSGIVAGRISQFLSLYPLHTQQSVLDLTAVVERWPDSLSPSAELTSLYVRLPMLDFSRDVLQTHPHDLQFLTVPPCGWNDVGTPARLAQAQQTLRPTPPKTGEHAFNFAIACNRANLATLTSRAPDQSSINVVST
jgi:mannose-1-phosphate guanylyltransferase